MNTSEIPRLMSKPPVTVVIPVKNEEVNLPLCLESVKAFDDVLIVDSGSIDRTREIAKLYGREVVEFKWNGKFPKKRNWVLRSYTFKYPWILFLDADERVTSDFLKEICSVLQGTPHHAFWIRYEEWFLGRLLKHGDPMKKKALLKVGYGEFEKILEDRWSALDMEIHEHVIVNGTEGIITSPLEHYDRRPLSSFFEKHNEYSSWEVYRYQTANNCQCLTFRQKVKYGLLMWKVFPFAYFIVSYILKGGFRDGTAGFYYAILKLSHFYHIQAKIYEAEILAKTVPVISDGCNH